VGTSSEGSTSVLVGFGTKESGMSEQSRKSRLWKSDRLFRICRSRLQRRLGRQKCGPAGIDGDPILKPRHDLMQRSKDPARV
jgi:hypothetical protein